MKPSSQFQRHSLNSSVSTGKRTGLQSNSLTMSDIQPRNNNDELVAKKTLMLKPRRPLPSICSPSPPLSLHTIDEVGKRKRRSDSISSNQNQSYNIFDSPTNCTPPRQTPRVSCISETIRMQNLSLESPIALKRPSGSACSSAPPNKEGHHQSSLASPGKSSCSSFSSFVKSPSPLPKPRQRNASSSPPKASKRLTRLPLDHPNSNFTVLIDESQSCSRSSSSSDDDEVSAITTPRDWARFPDRETTSSKAAMGQSSPPTCGFQNQNLACTPKRTSTSERQSRNIVGACDFPSSIPDFPIMGCKDTFMVSNPHQDEGVSNELEPRGSLVDAKVCKHEESRKKALLGTTVVINNVGFIPDTPYSSDTESDDGFFLANPEHLLKEQDSESNITGVERRAKQIRREKFSSPSESLLVHF